MRIPGSLSAWIAAWVVMLCAASVPANEAKKKPVRPPTKQTQVLRQDVFKKLEVVQASFESKDYVAALSGLDAIKARADKLNDYERATLYNTYAVVYYAQNRIPDATKAYLELLKQPNLPEALRDGGYIALAQMYFLGEDYAKAVRVLQHYHRIEGVVPTAESHTLLAQAQYQQQDWNGAETSLLAALRAARQAGAQPKENTLALLRAVYYEQKEYAKAARVLEALMTRFPGANYALQLAGIYGLLGDQGRQLATMHAAWRGGWLEREADLLNLARLYLLEEMPYPAVRLLARSMHDHRIERTADNLRLFAQALSLSREYDKQIPVLKELARLDPDWHNQTYLGHAYTELGQWGDAAQAFREALRLAKAEAPNSLRLQLGSVLVNDGKLQDAREVFVQAREHQTGQDSTVETWLRYVDLELEKRRQLRNG